MRVVKFGSPFTGVEFNGTTVVEVPRGTAMSSLMRYIDNVILTRYASDPTCWSGSSELRRTQPYAH